MDVYVSKQPPNFLLSGDSKPDISTCGANFCPGKASAIITNTSNETTAVVNEASYSTVITLLSIYLATGVIAVLLIAILLDKVSVLGSDKRDNGVCNLFIATLKHLKDRRMQLLVVLTMYSGLEQGFVFGDFTQVSILIYILTSGLLQPECAPT